MKILTRIPNPNDGVSLYRGFGPLGHLRTMMDVEFHQAQEFNWATLSQCDGIYMVRPATDNDLALMRMANACQKKVWIDYDDHILKIPPHNPAHAFYQRPNIRKNIQRLIEEAHVVSVSTQLLADEFQTFRTWEGGKIHVIPNAFPTNLLAWNGPMAPRNKVISWRGSRTHDKDLSYAHAFLLEAQKRLIDWEFHFFGEIDYQTLSLLPPTRTKIFPYTDVIDYFHQLKSSAPAVHIVPLEDNEFNRSKSNIAWIEATWAGATVFTNALPEFAKPGVLPLENIWDHIGMFTAHTSQALSHEFIQRNLLLDNVNHLRRDILNGL
jgi:hypothetical protein